MASSRRKINFGAGPSQLPLEVLDRASRELLNSAESGMSVMEMTPQDPVYTHIHNQAISDLKELLNISEEFQVLFMQNGARMQFDATGLNLAKRFPIGNYLVTGFWSDMACEWGQKYVRTTVTATSKPQGFSRIPSMDTWTWDSSGYFYYCSNETINGVEYLPSPDTFQALGSMPVIADMSSNILTVPVNISAHGVVFAGAQKNLGPAGVTVAIVRKDLIGSALPITPSLLDWKQISEANSMYNTPPTYMIYVLGLYLEYVKRRGGVQTFYEESCRKSEMIYDVIDESMGFYTSRIEKECRSRVNVPMSIQGGNAELERLFLSQAEAHNMTQLAGHKSAGGLRVSLYNGITIAETQQLADFMQEFKSTHQN